MKFCKAALLTILFMLTACSSIDDPVVRYYVFELPKLDTQTTNQKQTIMIQQVQLAPHLNTRSMVQQIDNLQIASSNWHLWAMNPSEMLTQATTKHLQNNFSDYRVVSANDNNFAYNGKLVTISLSRFNGGLKNNAIVSGRWEIKNANNALILEQHFHYDEALNDNGYGALAAALQIAFENMLFDLTQAMLALEKSDKY